MNEQVKYLTEEIGLGQDDARKRLQDEGLWMLPPEALLGFEPEEAVEEWTGAIDGLGRAAELFSNYNAATSQALWDARERASEALRRAQRRLQEK